MSNVAAILALEERRRSAMLASDGGALGALLAPDLRYVHSTGGVETRDTLLTKLAAGEVVYRHLVFDHLAVNCTPDAALVSGEMRAKVQRSEVVRDIASCYLAVWLRRNDTWQLAALQGTPLAAR